MYQFKTNYSEKNPYPLCLGIILQSIICNRTGLKWNVDYNAIDTSDVLDIPRFYMIETWYKIMFGNIKKLFVVLLTNIVTFYNHTKYIFLTNQKCEIQPTIISLHPRKYSQKLYFYLFLVKLGRLCWKL